MNDTKNFIIENKLIAIARRLPSSCIIDVAKALRAGGIRCMEITFDQASSTCLEDTVTAIRMLKRTFGQDMRIGAGTVLTIEQVEYAYESGADFILSPNVDETVIQKTKTLGMVSIPGALTPSEIVSAYNAGGDIIKVFPIGVFGLNYLKAILAPINHIPMMGVGGITSENLKEFLKVGICSFGIGSNLVRNDFAENGEFEKISILAESYIKKIKETS